MAGANFFTAVLYVAHINAVSNTSTTALLIAPLPVSGRSNTRPTVPIALSASPNRNRLEWKSQRSAGKKITASVQENRMLDLLNNETNAGYSHFMANVQLICDRKFGRLG